MKKADKAKALKTSEKTSDKTSDKVPNKTSSKTSNKGAEKVTVKPKKNATPAKLQKVGSPAESTVKAAKASVSASKPVPKVAAKSKVAQPVIKQPVKPQQVKATALAGTRKSSAPSPALVTPKLLGKIPVEMPIQAPIQKAKPAPPKSAGKISHPLTNPKSVTASLAPVKPPVPATPVSAASDSNQVPTRMARPSARLAQITVPSMAQSVASTAAKASYSQAPQSAVPAPVIYTAAKKDPKLANNWKTKSAEQLTDEEVLSMSDAEYMNDKQMAFFRLKLVALKLGILNSADQTTEHLREDTVIVPDPADRATIEEEHALELRTRDRERKLLKKIEQSIGRIDANDYGYCDETGEPIGVGRLLARPTATLSLEAQQRRELKQKMFGD